MVFGTRDKSLHGNRVRLARTAGRGGICAPTHAHTHIHRQVHAYTLGHMWTHTHTLARGFYPRGAAREVPPVTVLNSDVRPRRVARSKRRRRSRSHIPAGTGSGMEIVGRSHVHPSVRLSCLIDDVLTYTHTHTRTGVYARTYAYANAHARTHSPGNVRAYTRASSSTASAAPSTLRGAPYFSSPN